ncbi:unnamed protein product [Fraxinus pennsylvanica]|uniref:PPM-type phosphatase domain-containing protein n=1 Tax=Fraxinus pennsylvanica TaxID=56036 RepID=A0AAD1ZG35_9LAMI|nr:unnamed protein product [Fraxinus pennsylvanica]
MSKASPLVHGSFAVSSAIGGGHLKKWVTAEPTIEVFRITKESKFLILASDGLWDKVSNQEATDVVHHLCVRVDKPELYSIYKKIVDLSHSRGSSDDISYGQAGRVHGSFAISSAIGGGHLKQWVTAEPTIEVFRITKESKFLILASDGLWDKVSNKKATDVVHPLCVRVDKPELYSICKKIVDLSHLRGSSDDISYGDPSKSIHSVTHMLRIT